MARQKLGQHFLIKGKVLDRIAKAACGDGVPLVVEIGPGRGALTERLLGLADRTVAIEVDPALAELLRQKYGDTYEGRLTVFEANAMHLDWSQWGAGVVAGNLPYYIATALINKYLHEPGKLRQAVFLIQKEVAERITASPGTREYGYLSVECQLLAKVEYLSTVAPGAFQPPPKVDSAVIRLTPRTPEIENVPGFLAFASACFRQKRKNLRNNLAGKYAVQGDCDLTLRAEQLPLRQMLDLYETTTLEPQALKRGE